MKGSLNSVRAQIIRKHHLASLWLTRFRGGFTIDLISVEPEHQGQGHGAKAMEDLIKYADANGLKMALKASGDYGSDKARLEAWYDSLGFKKQGTKMVREPLQK